MTPPAQSAVTYCLLAVNPEHEEAIVSRQQAFVAHGGTFASIFSSNGRALTIPGGEGGGGCH